MGGIQVLYLFISRSFSRKSGILTRSHKSVSCFWYAVLYDTATGLLSFWLASSSPKLTSLPCAICLSMNSLAFTLRFHEVSMSTAILQLKRICELWAPFPVLWNLLNLRKAEQVGWLGIFLVIRSNPSWILIFTESIISKRGCPCQAGPLHFASFHRISDRFSQVRYMIWTYSSSPALHNQCVPSCKSLNPPHSLIMMKGYLC